MGKRNIDSHMPGGIDPGHGSGPDCSSDKESTGNTMEMEAGSILENPQAMKAGGVMEDANVMENSQTMEDANAMENSQTMEDANAMENSQTMESENAMENSQTMEDANAMENSRIMEGENAMENDQTIKAGGTRESGKLLPLFLTFLKIGAFTFGGGYAMIPLIQKEVVEKQKWISDQDILEIVAIAESTPGPIAINAATFVGYRTAGFAGAFLATLGVVLPSFFIILGISFVLRQFQEQKMVQYAFQGIRAGVLALIAKACFSMYKQSPKSGIAYGIMVTALICVAFFQVNVLLVIAGCACVGLISSILAERRHRT